MSESSLAPQVVRQFTEKGLTLGTAESLTAGLIAATVADVSGASAVLMGGVVSYDPRVKHEVLGVSQEVIDTAQNLLRKYFIELQTPHLETRVTAYV